MPARVPVLLAVLAILAGLASLSPSSARAATHAVTIADFAFAPATLTITVGDTVTWTNEDAVEHTATSTTGEFDSGLLAQGASFSHTFTTAGTYDYLCTPHPTMTGRIVVQAAAPAPTAAPSTPTSPATGGELPNAAMAAPRPPSPTATLGIALLAAAVTLAAVRFTREARVRTP